MALISHQPKRRRIDSDLPAPNWLLVLDIRGYRETIAAYAAPTVLKRPGDLYVSRNNPAGWFRRQTNVFPIIFLIIARENFQ